MTITVMPVFTGHLHSIAESAPLTRHGRGWSRGWSRGRPERGRRPGPSGNFLSP